MSRACRCFKNPCACRGPAKNGAIMLVGATNRPRCAICRQALDARAKKVQGGYAHESCLRLREKFPYKNARPCYCASVSRGKCDFCTGARKVTPAVLRQFTAWAKRSRASRNSYAAMPLALAVEVALQHVGAGRPVLLWDGSGWEVAVRPDDSYATPSGRSKSGGIEYLRAGAGMVKSFKITVVDADTYADLGRSRPSRNALSQKDAAAILKRRAAALKESRAYLARGKTSLGHEGRMYADGLRDAVRIAGVDRKADFGGARARKNKPRFTTRTVPLKSLKLDDRMREAVRLFTEAHGAPPTRVRIYDYPDGRKEVTEHVGYSMGKAAIRIDVVEDKDGNEVTLREPLEIDAVYSVDPRKSPKKSGGQYYHGSKEEGGKPGQLFMDVETGLPTTVGGTVVVRDGWLSK